MAERMVTLERNTNETQIELTFDLDGTGRYEIDTGCGFLNHMLELFARHGRFDLVLTCHGDVQVDYHHTPRTWALRWDRPLPGRWARCAASAATAAFICLWTRHWCCARWIFPGEEK